MENTSGPTHDRDNGLLAVNSTSRSGCDAGTQTPQMIRHHTPTRRHPIRAPSPGSSSSDESLTYEDTISYQPSARNVEVSRVLPIPDVVIEHSNDTFPLTQELFSSSSLDQPSGFTNLAFVGKEEMVRSSSTGNFQQQADEHHVGDSIILQQNQHLFVPNNPLDPRNFSMANVNSRLYYSLPKDSRRKHLAKDLQIHSQPPTPQMKHAKASAAAIGIEDSNFWIIPRVHSSESLNTTSAPTDNVAGLYGVSGRSAVVSNGFPEPVLGLYEMHLIPAVETPVQSAPRSVRKFEFTRTPASVERKRKRLQWCTDSLSLLFMIPGILVAAITPVLVVPLFYVTPPYFAPHILIFLACGSLSAVFLSFSGLVGNVVWHYDEKAKKLRPRLHCGKGPTFHFWGNGFYAEGVDQQHRKELIV